MTVTEVIPTQDATQAPTRGRRLVRNTIRNTLSPGDMITVPFGAYVRQNAHEEGRISRRSVKVEVVETTDGYVDVWGKEGQGKGFIILPTVSWKGDGARVYWTKVTPELLGIAQAQMFYVPRLELRGRRLDYPPSCGPGYDNRDVI